MYLILHNRPLSLLPLYKCVYVCVHVVEVVKKGIDVSTLEPPPNTHIHARKYGLCSHLAHVPYPS